MSINPNGLNHIRDLMQKTGLLSGGKKEKKQSVALTYVRHFFNTKEWKEMLVNNYTDIQKMNARSISWMSIIFMFMGILMTAAAYVIRDVHLMPVWVALFIVSLLYFYLSENAFASSASTEILVYSYPFLLYFGALYTIYFKYPRANFISAMAFLIIIPSLFIVHPGMLMITSILATTVCIRLNTVNPLPLLPKTELNINYLICGIGGMLFGLYTCFYKLHGLDDRRKLKAVAREDQALAVLSRRSFFEDFASEKQQEELAGLIIVNVDHMKQINKTYGSKTGDLCLEAVVRVLKKIGHEHGITFYHFGGDEFIGAIPVNKDKGTSLSLGDQVVEAVNRGIEEEKVVSSGKRDVYFTASAGYARMRHGIKNAFDSCIDEAEKKMHNNKIVFEQLTGGIKDEAGSSASASAG